MRSIDEARLSLAKTLRMDVTARSSSSQGEVLFYTLASKQHLTQMASGCDADIGGLSSARLGLDPEEEKGRFWGTLSSEIPRGARIERSGYAGFRNMVCRLATPTVPPHSTIL